MRKVLFQSNGLGKDLARSRRRSFGPTSTKVTGDSRSLEVCSINLDNCVQKLADRQRKKGVLQLAQWNLMTLAVFSTERSHFLTALQGILTVMYFRSFIDVLETPTRVANSNEMFENGSFQNWQHSSAPTGDVTMFLHHGTCSMIFQWSVCRDSLIPPSIAVGPTSQYPWPLLIWQLLELSNLVYLVWICLDFMLKQLIS